MEITRNKNKLDISRNGSSIKVKLKHVPVFLMMLQKHYNPYSYDESFGFHTVIKSSAEKTIIIKRGGLRIKYSISQHEDGTRLYGKGDNYLLVTEELVNSLIHGIAHLYNEDSND